MSGKDFWTTFAPVLGLLIVFVIAFFAVYRKDISYMPEPTIEIISGNEIVTDQAEVPITGVVHNTSKVTVDGKEVSVAGDGGFNATVPVAIGENSIVVVAGGASGTSSTVKITREEVAKSVSPGGAAAEVTAGGLATSGPAENILGAFGLAAIIISMFVYRRSLGQNTLQNTKNSL